ncbi:DUF2939 domain-containing protein [Noviherbaspirillum aerium]|uniref:DUF2939 domain-containing protein n=1 Tax=Noviherbaspirillum aerium TaxID=2588497 RepID=UPI00124C4104|nr:DUF2939 domain-containing protein [Noviherbaspirillum aerium]
MKLRKIAVAVALLGLVLVTASYFSPHWTVYRMRVAIEKRDYKTFSSYADFPALRDSFRSQLLAGGAGPGINPHSADNVLKRLGQEIGGLVMGPMIDAAVGPAGVMEMLNSGVPGITQTVIKSTITQVPAAGEAMPSMNIAYQGWSRVAFRGDGALEKDGSFILVRSGFWSWRLAEVVLPRQP